MDGKIHLMRVHQFIEGSDMGALSLVGWDLQYVFNTLGGDWITVDYDSRTILGSRRSIEKLMDSVAKQSMPLGYTEEKIKNYCAEWGE